MYSVSSAFIYNASQQNASWTRRLLIGTSDYTNYVTKWPTISKTWDKINPQTVTIDLSNEGKTFNFYTADPTQMRTNVKLQLGFTYAGSEELITMFAGTVDAARYSGGGCSLTLIDKFKKLADRKIADTTSPQLYTSSEYLIHDMAWYLCTSHGGLSATANSGNTDIDYASFNSWTSLFSSDNVRIQGRFTGQTPLELLHQLSTLTQSAIYIEDDKLKFGRFLLTDSAYYTLDGDTIVDATTTLDDRELVNKAYVSAAYNVSSQSFGITVSQVNTASVNSYGTREVLVSEQYLWLTNSVSAINLSARMLGTGAQIKNKYQVKAPMHAIAATIGDTLHYVDTLMDVSDTFRIMQETVDLDSASKTFNIDQSQYFGGFILDVTSLDGSEVLT